VLERGAEVLLIKPTNFGTLRSKIDMRVEHCPLNLLDFAAAQNVAIDVVDGARSKQRGALW
jgi:hypothetical protein